MKCVAAGKLVFQNNHFKKALNIRQRLEQKNERQQTPRAAMEQIASNK